MNADHLRSSLQSLIDQGASIPMIRKALADMGEGTPHVNQAIHVDRANNQWRARIGHRKVYLGSITNDPTGAAALLRYQQGVAEFNATGTYTSRARDQNTPTVASEAFVIPSRHVQDDAVPSREFAPSVSSELIDAKSVAEGEALATFTTRFKINGPKGKAKGVKKVKQSTMLEAPTVAIGKLKRWDKRRGELLSSKAVQASRLQASAVQ